MKPTRWFSALAFTMLLGGFAAWATIDTVDEDTGTIGTVFHVHGSAFGAAKAPKVALSRISDGKQLKLKVTAFSDTDLTAQLASTFNGAAGDYNVVVTPPGSTAQTSAAVVTMTVGRIDTVTPASPAAGGAVTIAGTFFGAKKGKVVVGGKKAKVTTWTDTQVVATLHKKTPSGSQSLSLVNKVGTAVKTDAVDVGGSGGVPASLPRMTARLFHFNGNANNTETSVSHIGTGFTVQGLVKGTGGVTYAVGVDYSNIDLANLQTGLDQTHPQNVSIAFGDGIATNWSATSGLTARLIVRDTSISGDIRGDLARTSGSAEPATQENVIITFDIAR